MIHYTKAEKAIMDSESLEPFEEAIYPGNGPVESRAFYIGCQNIQKRLKLNNILITKQNYTVTITKLDNEYLLPPKKRERRKKINVY
jgi:hypothetical protein